MKKLSNTLARLCNRLAAEEMKSTTWRLGQALRDEYLRRIAAGESIACLEADLHQRLARSAVAQFQLRVVSQPEASVERRNVSQPSSLQPRTS